MISLVNHTLKANGIRQNFIDAGKGAPVVLLHGFPETNFAWRHQIPVLGELYRIIAPENCSMPWASGGSLLSGMIAARASRRVLPRTILIASTVSS